MQVFCGVSAEKGSVSALHICTQLKVPELLNYLHHVSKC